MYRILNKKLKNSLNKKVLVLIGPRQAGKTTLLKNTFPKARYLNIEEKNYIEILNSRDLEKIKEAMSLVKGEISPDGEIWIFDEVQRLDDPGLVAKVIHDNLKDQNFQLLISGSSALEIANKSSESLAGRKKTFALYPLAFQEFLVQKGKIDPGENQTLNFELKETREFSSEMKRAMQYGLYPETLNFKSDAEIENYLLELTDSTILKDVYYLNLVKNTKNLLSLLKLLAHQIGGQVNFSDLANRIGISRKTVVDYVEILKKTFVIFTLSPYTKKRRDEIGKTEKIFFHDLGIRNALIQDFSPVQFRRDWGNIFENFIISEIKKLNDYYKQNFGLYYWRTKWGSEVDLVLFKDGFHHALEIKVKKGAITRAFKETYPETKELIVTLENAASLLV